MPITDHEGLDALCASCGIALDYHDIRGQRHEPGIDVKRSLLAALRLPVNSDDDIRHNLQQLESRKWRQIVAPAVVCRQNGLPIRLTLTLNSSQIDIPISWALNQEGGQPRHDERKINAADAEYRAADLRHWLRIRLTAGVFGCILSVDNYRFVNISTKIFRKLLWTHFFL